MSLACGENMYIDFDTLEAITNNFADGQKVGCGGYGDVYRGVYNGQEVAVKKLHHLHGLDDKEFNNEFRILTEIHHQNIIRLLGYCYESRRKYVVHEGRLVLARQIERAICFEYMQGGSLDKHISEESCDLDWPTCYKIIEGICEGLNHLHTAQVKPIYHLDLKPSNILLDKDMTAKIGDLGLSTLVSSTKTHETEIVKGTYAHTYMPPEYIDKGVISKKFDVFSLGVIIIQLMAGNNGNSRHYKMSHEEFIELVTEKWKGKLQGRSGHSSRERSILQVKACIEMALRCVDPDPERRPHINNILRELEALKAMVKKMPLYLHPSKDLIDLQDVDASVLDKESQETSNKAMVSQESSQATAAKPCRTGTEHGNATAGPTSRVQGNLNEWVLDTSAWTHHTFNLRLLRDLTTYNLEEVADALPSDGEDCLPVLGRGSVVSERFTVPDVNYIQGESRNVISVAQLARSHALVTIFEPTRCYVMDKMTEKIVGKGQIRNGAYMLDYLLISQEKGGGRAGGNDREAKQEGGCGGAGGSQFGGGNGDGGGGQGTGDQAGDQGGGQSEGQGSGGQAEGKGGGDQAGGGADGGNGGGGKEKEEKDKEGEEEENKEEGKEEQDKEEEEEENEKEGKEEKDKEEKEEENEGEEMKRGEEDITEEERLQLSKMLRAFISLIQSESSVDTVPTTGVFVTPTQRDPDFIMDSGACRHVTYFTLNQGVFKAYPWSLNIMPDIPSINGVDGVPLQVRGIGYLEDHSSAIDFVLYVPCSVANCVSVGKLSSDYSVSVLFGEHGFSILRPGTWETVGYGKEKGKVYVLDHFRAGRLVPT